MLYHAYEFGRTAIAPWRAAADMGQAIWRSPLNPMAETLPGRSIAAAFDVFEASTRRYAKPQFGLEHTNIHGQPVEVTEETLWRSTWCRLKHFKRDPKALSQLHKPSHADPKVLIIPPMSGHYATLLRGTVAAMLPEHDVHIVDWQDARLVPITEGRFDLNDMIDTLMEILRFMGPDVHVIAVCQPGPAALSATAVMAEDHDPCQPATLTIMGSPIDPRKSPTVPNLLAQERKLSWFQRNVVMAVPFPNPGAMRRVYPGFVQLSSFMAMNKNQHMKAQREYFANQVKGDGDSADKHREFYDEYLAVMDLTEEFYLQTIDEIFQRHLLPRGEFIHRGRLVNPKKIRTTALMTVEGEEDDISGIGQTQAAHDLCTEIPEARRLDYIQSGVGHYGVFNGSRFRTEVQPRIRDFIRSFPRRPKKI
jgi:poly(3-hydroxybutyrate) depolymerase